MSIPRTTARKLCTDVEFRLVDESFAPQVTQLSEKGLAQRLSRARTARDKYRSLAERQVRETKGRISPKGKRPAQGNENTVLKQTIFDQALARYEKHLAPSGAQESSASKKSMSKAPEKTKAVSKQSEAKPAAGKASASKKTQGKQSAAEKPAVKKSVSKKAASKKSATSPSDDQKPTAEKRATKKANAKKASAKKALKVKLPTLSKLVADVAHVVAERKADTANPAEEATPEQNAGSSMAGPPPGRTPEQETIPGPNPKGPEFPRMPHERGRQSAMQKQAQARRDGR